MINGDIMNRPQFAGGWRSGLPETPCGVGSTIARTERQRKWIPEIVKRYDIHTIANVGAGALNWWPLMELPQDVDTVHLDLVPRSEGVQLFDIVDTVPPKVDLIVCVWVLNHLPLEDCKQAIENIRASGTRYLIVTDRYLPEDQFTPIEVLILNNGAQMIFTELSCA